MADVSDVENALVGIVAGALFPGQSYLPGATQASSVTGGNVRVYRGFPVANELDAELKAGTSTVSIFPRAGMNRTVTRYPAEWFDTTGPTATITVDTSGDVVTFGGSAGVTQLCGVVANGLAYVYSASATDTPATVAASLATLVPGATANAGALTVPNAPDLLGRVVGFATAAMETRRQETGFTITCWCPTPNIRDTLASAVDNAIAGLLDENANSTLFIALADGTKGLLRYRGSFTDDEPQEDNLWRRQLIYTVEYPTLLVRDFPAMLFGWLNLNGVYYLDTFGAHSDAQTDFSDALVDEFGVPINL